MTQIIRRLVLAALLITGLSPAIAQQFPTVPNRTVIGRIGSGTGSGPAQAIPFATLFSQINGTLTINPPVNTTDQAVVVNQTLPFGMASSGTSYSGSLFNVINNGYESPEGTSGDPVFGLYGVTSGFRVNMQSAGKGLGAFPIMIGGLFATKATSAGQQLVGLNGTTYTNIDSAGHDGFWSLIGYANIGPSANIKSVIGIDAEVATSPTASILYRVGVGSVSQGSGLGSLVDAAFALSAQDDKYGAAAPWNNAFVFWNTGHAPFSNAAFISDAPFTAQYFAKLDNVTFANKIFDFGASVFQMDGAGNATFGGSVNFKTFTSLVNNANSATVMSVTNTSTGAAATASTTITNNLDQSSFGLAGSNYTTLSQLANRAYVHSGPANNGIILDAGGSKPIDFYINNARVGGFTAGGALTLTAGYPTTGLTGTLQAAQEPAHTGDMTNTGGSLATTVVAINGDNQTTAWTTYTPTITAGSGSFTTVSATGRWRRIGKTVIVQADITITTAGTAASTLFASLPLTAAAFNYAGSAIEVTAGKSGATRIAPSGTTMGALDATAATFIANGKEVVMTSVYEIP